MLQHIYHSHVGSCNLSSIRIIIYSAAEAQEVLIHCRRENICWSLGSGLLRLNDEHTIQIPRSLQRPWLMCTVRHAAPRRLQHLPSSCGPQRLCRGSSALLVLQFRPKSPQKTLTQPFSLGLTPLKCIIGAIAKILEAQRYNNLQATFTIFIIIKYFQGCEASVVVVSRTH